jgi:hypothetical protein
MKKINKLLFKPQRTYSVDEVIKIAKKHGYETTDCQEDEFPNITVDINEEPHWQFVYVTEEIVQLMWTIWD